MANKARHEDVGRAAVEFIGRGELLELPRREDHNAVSHRQGLCLIVGDQDAGHAELLLQAPDFAARLDPDLGVQVGERLVQQ